MQIQLNSDNHIVSSSGLFERVQKTVEHELRHVAASITRVEVHVNDVNSAKKGEHDKRCMLEARLAGMQPLSAEHRAQTVDLAVKGAALQLARAIKTSLGKADTGEKRGASIRHAMQDDGLPQEPAEGE